MTLILDRHVDVTMYLHTEMKFVGQVKAFEHVEDTDTFFAAVALTLIY